MEIVREIFLKMEHYFDAAKVLSLASEKSAKNETVGIDESEIMSQISEDSYDHERYLQLIMLFLVLFFLVRKLSKNMKGLVLINHTYPLVSEAVLDCTVHLPPDRDR